MSTLVIVNLLCINRISFPRRQIFLFVTPALVLGEHSLNGTH